MLDALSYDTRVFIPTELLTPPLKKELLLMKKVQAHSVFSREDHN